MSTLSNSQERNARALETAGRMVSELIGELRLGMFDTRVEPEVRELLREQHSAEIADLTVKLAEKIVHFI